MDINKGLGCFADLKLDIICLNPDYQTAIKVHTQNLYQMSVIPISPD
ncbi:MAG: hypothetical protein LBH25_06700 [Fibromonadaceae bacterium]|jgi:hypothetical protein|nr:hypothetical protein [Fibromonadaceae bacterium]